MRKANVFMLVDGFHSEDERGVASIEAAFDEFVKSLKPKGVTIERATFSSKAAEEESED